MEEKLNQLKAINAQYIDLYRIVNLLEWDMQTNMPPGGAKERGDQIALIRGKMHACLCSDELGRLLDDLEPLADQLEPDSDTARLLKVNRREYDKRTHVPAALITEMAETTAVSHQAWVQAREENDFAKFQPYLEKVVDLRRRYADCFAPYEHVYDPLLAEYEPGMKTDEVRAIFTALRPQQVELLQKITSRPQVDDSPLHQPYDIQKQWDFGVAVITKFGYDWRRGRQDKAAHPFTTEFGQGDVRITTRFLPDYVGSALFSSMHECGHALFEQGIAPELNRQLSGRTYSLALHESQSRMWENLVGRSLPFWQHFYPLLQETFPAQLGNVTLASFYKGINKVEPSLIRVEADEATYNLHIMLRLELEIALVSGEVQVKDLPEAWNARMQDYLGLTPPNDSQGVLQDVHWAHGYMGYFSTYALGNLVSGQLWERINQDIPDLEEQMRRGRFADLLDWTRQKIHRHGGKFEAQELVKQVTGSTIDPAPYMRYLEGKYAQIYDF
jgi:carboxypeptidase Taq